MCHWRYLMIEGRKRKLEDKAEQEGSKRRKEAPDEAPEREAVEEGLNTVDPPGDQSRATILLPAQQEAFQDSANEEMIDGDDGYVVEHGNLIKDGVMIADGSLFQDNALGHRRMDEVIDQEAHTEVEGHDHGLPRSSETLLVMALSSPAALPQPLP